MISKCPLLVEAHANEYHHSTKLLNARSRQLRPQQNMSFIFQDFEVSKEIRYGQGMSNALASEDLTDNQNLKATHLHDDLRSISFLSLTQSTQNLRQVCYHGLTAVLKPPTISKHSIQITS